MVFTMQKLRMRKIDFFSCPFLVSKRCSNFLPKNNECQGILVVTTQHTELQFLIIHVSGSFDLIDSSENSNNSQLIKNDKSFCGLKLHVDGIDLQMQCQLTVFYYLPTSRVRFSSF